MATALNTIQSAMVLNETIAMTGIFPSRDTYNDGMTLGMFHTYGFNFGLTYAPIATGQIIAISQNTALFSLLGTNYGGNGVSNFALPDLVGRTSVADGQGPGLTPLVIGEITGAPSVVLTQAELPTSVGGVFAPFDEDQPALAVKYMIREEGIYPTNGSSGTALNFIGSVVKFAGNFVPGGYLECNGQLLNIGTHDVLFSLIGTTYGGDGVTTFALPDLRGRTIVGAGNGHTVGEVFGAEDVLITQSNLPGQMGGVGQPIVNTEPSLVLNYAIALQGIFPSRDGGGADSNTPFLGEIIAFAGNFPPGGFALCQGQLLAINQNQALFSLLGTQYGGDGRVTFALPDLRDRAVVGTETGLDVGQIIGSDTTYLTLDNIPDLNYAGSEIAGNHYGGNGNDFINGLGGDDTLVGNGGNDRLFGGTGMDAMTGGVGNDTYYVDDALDTVIEAVGGGFDVVLASVNYALAAGQEIERLVTTSVAGTGALMLTGNEINNQIYGNNGANIIDGLGGRDLMTGYGGNDSYYVDNALDLVVEAGGNGFDVVYTSVNVALAAGQEIERLTTTNYTLTDALNLTGNAINNQIYGNNGANLINGGLGNDLLTGLGGIDIFRFSAALDAVTNHDTIADFNVIDDTIQLENATFTLLASLGVLAANLFEDNSIAGQGGSEIVIYDKANGNLYYDTNGAATVGGLVLFADVANNTALTNADFVVT